MGCLMTKAKLNLSIDTDLLDLAKNFTDSNNEKLNLSQEFEEWVKIRIQKNINMEVERVDYDFEKAKLRQDLALLESKQELFNREELKEKEEEMIINQIVNNLKNTKKEKEDYLFQTENIRKKVRIKEDDIIEKANAIVYIFKKKLDKKITVEKAKEIIKEKLNAD